MNERLNGRPSMREGIAWILKRCSRSMDALLDMMGNTPRLLNFLRGIVEFQPREDDIFVVTYPRSGTTWMQMILYQLTTNGRMDFAHISQVCPWFERSLALGTMDAQDLESLPSPRIFKSHLPYHWLPRDCRYIYITRNGMDVAVSYYHLYRSHLGFEGSFPDFFDRFLRGRVQYKSWFKHLACWQTRSGDSEVLFVRYEDMLSDPDKVIARVAEFCRLEISDRKLYRVRRRCSFEFMKRHQSKFDHSTRLLLDRGIRPNSFIRKGAKGDGADWLTDSQKADFHQHVEKAAKSPIIELDLAAFLR